MSSLPSNINRPAAFGRRRPWPVQGDVRSPAPALVLPRCRGGFSLLEVMLATAMLAASAMVLSSLIGLGAKYGSRAEARTEGLSQAQSLLAEFLAMPEAEPELESERTGVLNSTPPRSFRIRMNEASTSGGDAADSLSPGTSSTVSSSGMPSPNTPPLSAPGPASGTASYGVDSAVGNSADAARPSRLVLVTVEIFENANADAETSQAPLTQLSQLVRVPAVETP